VAHQLVEQGTWTVIGEFADGAPSIHVN